MKEKPGPYPHGTRKKELTRIIQGINASLSAFPAGSTEALALLKDLKTAKDKLKKWAQ